jgi:hypothetical protein
MIVICEIGTRRICQRLLSSRSCPRIQGGGRKGNAANEINPEFVLDDYSATGGHR